MKILRPIVLAMSFACTASLVQAQAITQIVHTVYPQGGATPAQTPATLNISSFTCGLKPKIPRPLTTAVNATKIIIDDPNDVTSDCSFTDSLTANGGLFSLPFGAAVYESTTKFINSALLAGPESARSNLFTHPGAAPPAPTGTRIVQSLVSGLTGHGFATRRARGGKPLYLVGDRRNRP